MFRRGLKEAGWSVWDGSWVEPHREEISKLVEVQLKSG